MRCSVYLLTFILAMTTAPSRAEEPGSANSPGPAALASGQTPAELLTAPAPPRPPKTPSDALGIGGFGGKPGYDVRGYFARQVSGQAADLSLIRQNLSVAVPLWREGSDTLLGNVRVRNLNVGTEAILPDSGQRFPENLWDIGFGLTGIRKFDNGWTAVLTGSIGSASDQPFHGLREMTLSVSGFLKVPAHREGDSWTFGLMYSPNGQLNFPIPLIRYDWNPSDQLNIGLGLPLSLRWKPTDEWRVDLSYVPLTTVNAKLTWLPSEQLSVYGGFEWDSEGYFLVERRERQDRFFYLEKRLVGGVRLGGFGPAAIEGFGGYAFDRSFGAGRSPLDYKYDEVGVASGPFLGARLSIRY